MNTDIKFNKGDKVRIKHNFYAHRYPGDPGVTDEMLEEEDKEYTVRRSRTKGTHELYYLLESPWTYADEWIESAEYIENIEIEEEDVLSMFK